MNTAFGLREDTDSWRLGLAAVIYCRHFACGFSAGSVVQCVSLTVQRSASCGHTAFIVPDVAAASELLVGVGVLYRKLSSKMPDCWLAVSFGSSCDRPPRHRFFSVPCFYKQTLRRFPTFQVATTCFSCSPPDLNLLVTNFIFCFSCLACIVVVILCVLL